MAKSLENLSEEYYKEAAGLTEQIKKYTQQLRKVYKSGDFLKTYDLKRKLKILYDQRNDVLDTAHLLKHYYDEDERSTAV